jgi:O-antigen/teichoic acid export membrane protein
VVAWTGFRNCDYAIIAARLGTAQAGFFWRGFQLAVEYQRKITSTMSYFGFPVLARTESMDDLLALRRRMVRLVTVTLFPVFASLAILAPVVVPLILGPAWEPAVLPTQILTAAGAATILTDNIGSSLMALGRTRTLLYFGAAHFAVYAVAVVFASGYGIAGVCVAAVAVHSVFLLIAYNRMLAGRPERTLEVFWGDVSAAGVSCVVLAAAALPLDIILRGTTTPPALHVTIVCSVAALTYLTALRAWFPDAWRDLATLLRKVLPSRPVRAIVAGTPVREAG